MKILGYDKGEQVLYIEKKDKKFYGEQTDISSTNGNIFEKVEDPNLRRQIMEDDKLVDFTKAYDMGMRKLYETINKLDNTEDPTILNQKEDLQRIYEFMMGRGEISFPLIAEKNTTSDVVSGGITYELASGVNPFAIIITKKSKDEMMRTDRYPEEAITIRIALMATFLGLEGYTYAAYKPQVELSEDRKTISFGVDFVYYASSMQRSEQKMISEMEQEKRTETRRNKSIFRKIKDILHQ